MKTNKWIKGRGAQENVHNQFFEHQHEALDDYLNYCFRDPDNYRDEDQTIKTKYIKVFPKTIVNKVDSPDVGMNYSLNPYQGCEHGCVYCYARNSHEYWGYSAGLDFESVILMKPDAPKLLEEKLKKKSWKAYPIVLSGNTDCYQPIEQKMQITRALLKVFLKYRHPVGIITKNALVQRDIDILSELAKDNLCRVIISVTSLSEKTRRLMEPRTASVKKRLQTIERLSKAGIPVMVMAGPVIPGINSHEIIPLVKTVTQSGALHVGYTIVRLNGAIGAIFENWIRKAYPYRADKVLHQIEQCHLGKRNDSEFGRRMKGEGHIAIQINDQFRIAKKKYLRRKVLPDFNLTLHEHFKSDQLRLF